MERLIRKKNDASIMKKFYYQFATCEIMRIQGSIQQYTPMCPLTIIVNS